MPASGHSHVRIARPSGDLAAAERLWCGGLGLGVVWRSGPGRRHEEHELLVVGWPAAAWHLELVRSADRPPPRPTEEDLLVVYLEEDVPEELVARLVEHAVVGVTSPNPYWNRWGVTVEDPDGYRLVLCSRAWRP